MNRENLHEYCTNTLWYIIGLIKGRKQGESDVVLDTDSYTFIDLYEDGNIVVTEADDV